VALSLVVVGSGSSPALAATQKWSWDIYGDCSDYFDMYDEYAMFEEDDSYTCYVTAKVTPTKPVRTFYLQYFNKKWVTESTAKTNSKGQVYLYPDAYNCGDYGSDYCDGTYTYRIWSPAVSGQKALTGEKFELVFYPIGSDY
jgi:hypothetical protein